MKALFQSSVVGGPVLTINTSYWTWSFNVFSGKETSRGSINVSLKSNIPNSGKNILKSWSNHWKKIKMKEFSFAACSQWRLTLSREKEGKKEQNAHVLHKVWKKHSHLCLTLKATWFALLKGGKPQIKMGPSTAGLQCHVGRGKHFSAILVQWALVTQINMFRQFSVLEECAAEKTEPLSWRRAGEHLKRIHWIQTTHTVSCNFKS